MIFADLPMNSAVFVDANIFVFYFQPHAVIGPSCTALINRIGLKELVGFTSTHVVSEVAHRLMTMEASMKFGWPTRIVNRLKQDPSAVQKLIDFRQACQQIPKLGFHMLTIDAPLVDIAAGVSQQYGLLTNDALVVAVMQANGLTNIASSDTDFDGVPTLTRYAPA
jgi:predicted nucleic acid-binding protein